MIRSTLPENGNFYRGNLHAHTVSSDGHNSTEELIQFYKDAKYDFLAITDHNIYTDLSDRSTDDFLLIPGAEIGIYKSSFLHVLAIGNPSESSFHHGKIFPADWRYHAKLPELIDLIHQNGNLAIYAHPTSSGTDIRSLMDLENLDGIEIFNAMQESSEKDGFSEVYFDQLIESDKKIMAYATDNTHNIKSPLFGSITVKADSLSYNSLFGALKSGAFYASCSKDIHHVAEIFNFYVNEKNEAIIECSKCRSVFIMSSKDSHLYEGPLHAPITFAVHPIPSGAEFVRAICTDYDGNISWTQAIWL